MYATAVLALKPHRFALGWVAFACLIVAAVAVVVAAWLATFPASPGCLDLAVRYTLACGGYPEALTIDQAWAGRVMAALAILPFVAGIVLGVPLVAAEIESRTASLAWWLEPSRRRWLLRRVLVIGTVLAVLLAVPAIAGDLLEWERVPRYDPATTVFLDYGARGALLVGRGIAAFALALLVGLLMGRVLPGLIVAGVTATVLFWLLGAARWVALPAPEPIASQPGRYFLVEAGSGVPSMFVDREGALYSSEQIVAAAPAPMGTPEFNAWYEAQGFSSAIYGIPGERLWIVEARELAGLAAGTAGLVGVSAWLVGSRRPG